MHILFVDDDRTFTPVIQEYLEGRGLRVSLYHDAETGLAAFRDGDFQLCILDVQMPFKDGFALAQEIRAIHPAIPFLFLTGQTSKEERIAGLKLGADDYVTKPFSVEELYLRIQAILRRTQTAMPDSKAAFESARIGQYQFHYSTRQLQGPADMVRLSAIEAQLLALFCRHPEGVIERETALRQIWKDEHLLHGRSLNVYVSRIRQFLKDDPAIEILNVHGTGYQLVVHPG